MIKPNDTFATVGSVVQPAIVPVSNFPKTPKFWPDIATSEPAEFMCLQMAKSVINGLFETDRLGQNNQTTAHEHSNVSFLSSLSTTKEKHSHIFLAMKELLN